MEPEELSKDILAKVKNAHWYKRILNKLCLDDRLSPNRRLLAAILGMQMDASTIIDKKTYTALLLGEFVTRSGIKLYDSEDRKNGDSRTTIEIEAAKQITDVFQEVLHIDFSKDNDYAE